MSWEIFKQFVKFRVYDNDSDELIQARKDEYERKVREALSRSIVRAEGVEAPDLSLVTKSGLFVNLLSASVLEEHVPGYKKMHVHTYTNVVNPQYPNYAVQQDDAKSLKESELFDSVALSADDQDIAGIP